MKLPLSEVVPLIVVVTLKVTLPWVFFCSMLVIELDRRNEEEDEEVEEAREVLKSVVSLEVVEAREARCSTVLKLLLVSEKAMNLCISAHVTSPGYNTEKQI